MTPETIKATFFLYLLENSDGRSKVAWNNAVVVALIRYLNFLFLQIMLRKFLSRFYLEKSESSGTGKYYIGPHVPICLAALRKHWQLHFIQHRKHQSCEKKVGRAFVMRFICTLRKAKKSKNKIGKWPLRL